MAYAAPSFYLAPDAPCHTRKHHHPAISTPQTISVFILLSCSAADVAVKRASPPAGQVPAYPPSARLPDRRFYAVRSGSAYPSPRSPVSQPRSPREQVRPLPCALNTRSAHALPYHARQVLRQTRIEGLDFYRLDQPAGAEQVQPFCRRAGRSPLFQRMPSILVRPRRYFCRENAVVIQHEGDRTQRLRMFPAPHGFTFG